jgi:tryptophanyl-tRNA synthetase
MRILTGIQPTNILHLGNLFGALKPAVALQSEHELHMMIADYHAITVPQDPETLHDNILFVAAAYLAAGVDPKKTIIFQQSQVPAHTELAWILQTQTRIGEAQRMTQFKDKSGGQTEKVSVGLFTYPMLMAADILLYDTHAVPVGADQKQHVELTRDLAQRFNKEFGETFTLPEPLIRAQGARIKSLAEPEKKMSKSSPNAKSYLSIMDSEDLIAKKIRSAVTDSEPGITVDDRREGLKNLLTIMSLITDETLPAIAGRYANQGMKNLKDDLAEAVTVYLRPLQAKIKGLLENTTELKEIIKIGSEAANELSDSKMALIRSRIGVKI